MKYSEMKKILREAKDCAHNFKTFPDMKNWETKKCITI